MKKKALGLFFFLISMLIISIVQAKEYNISDSLTSGFEYIHRIRIFDEEKIETAFGANWQQNFLFKDKAVNQADKFRIVRVTSNTTSGKSTWYIVYDYWELTTREFDEDPDTRLGQHLYKDPANWGTIHNWGTHIAMPGPVNEFLAEMDFDNTFVVSGYDLSWTIAKDSIWGTNLGLQQDVVFFYGYKGGYDLLATFRIKTTSGDIMFEYDEDPENKIPAFDICTLLIVSGISILGVIVFLNNNRRF